MCVSCAMGRASTTQCAAYGLREEGHSLGRSFFQANKRQPIKAALIFVATSSLVMNWTVRYRLFRSCRWRSLLQQTSIYHGDHKRIRSVGIRRTSNLSLGSLFQGGQQFCRNFSTPGQFDIFLLGVDVIEASG